MFSLCLIWHKTQANLIYAILGSSKNNEAHYKMRLNRVIVFPQVVFENLSKMSKNFSQQV